MGLTAELNSTHNISDVKQIQYFDTRYYKVQFEHKKQLVEAFFPSVTEILNAYPKPFLAHWRGEVGNDRADQIVADALKLGSFIHYGAETLAKGGAVLFHPLQGSLYNEDDLNKLQKEHGELVLCRHQEEYVQLYRIWQFFNAVSPTKIDTEQTVYSVKHQYAGTLDLLLWIEEGDYAIAGSKPVHLETGYYVGDYKTGKGVSFTYLLQLAAYMEAAMEGSDELRKHLKGGLIIHPNNNQTKNGIEGLKTTIVSRADQPEYFQGFMKTYEVYKLEKPVPTPKEFSMPSVLTYKPIAPDPPTKSKTKKARSSK